VEELLDLFAATDQIRSAAKEQSMRTLRDSGLLATFDGVTTVEKVLRETIDIF
jgi:type IV pilus assembly protein PilB